jgi:hypothetical protein
VKQGIVESLVIWINLTQDGFRIEKDCTFAAQLGGLNRQDTKSLKRAAFYGRTYFYSNANKKRYCKNGAWFQ